MGEDTLQPAGFAGIGGDHIAVYMGSDRIGIPAEDRAQVFRRFYRLDASRSTPGSGLGLSLVAAVAKLHDATISLEDNAPGVRVVIAFP